MSLFTLTQTTFGNEDHQEKKLKIGSDSSSTDDHSPTEYESGSEGDFDIDGNAEIGPSSRDMRELRRTIIVLIANRIGESSTVLFLELCHSEFVEEILWKSKCFFFSSSIGDQLKTILEKYARYWEKILWCGPKKPKFETYFVPFLREVEDLFINGLNWTLNGTNRLSKLMHLLEQWCQTPCNLMRLWMRILFAPRRNRREGFWIGKGLPLSCPMPDKRTHETTFQQADEACSNIRGPRTVVF
ncbi:hypothetical protein OUZ56_021866 [Daphnia magna]|uniref:Uncharacterized protein n=1 Tax=Daphnia magna TaxID=35525 RepID=A0ABR0AV80_9CRUS|nr:hypothetical protein OUZ56_021866 [Daphnia magna]